MMTLPALNLYLFGPLRIDLDGAAVVTRRRKAQALLAYLAVTRQPHSRDALATLLWPEFNQSQARTNLRRELAELRGLLGKGRLLDDRVTVALNQEPPFALDLTAFEEHLAQARQCLHPGHSVATDVCPTCLPQLDQAAALYTDDFLAGFALPDSPTFDDWQFFQTEEHRQTLARLLEQLVAGYHAAHQFADAIPPARRWVALDPLHEPAHCALMVAYELAGQRTAALRQYENCVRVLEEELGVPPAAETVALVARIRQQPHPNPPLLREGTVPLSNGGAESLSANSPPATPPPFQAPAPPPHFVGREAEITQLCTALLRPDTPIYALVGMGGAGKTTLAMQVAQLLRDDFRDGVLWANAVSSDPLDIAAAWARAYGYDFSGLSDLESRAAAIRGVLAEQAVLIVLDNVEQSSGIRPLLPNGNHCAILLTTRDLDAANALNAQVLFLGELSAENSRQLLMAILGAPRVTEEEEAAAAIGELLHYLPLAVEIVAQRLKSRPRQRLSQLVARLQDEAQRLALGISDRAVRASFAVSWAALDEELQRCFALLGVFAGRPFAAEAIAYMADAGLDVTEEWLFALEALSLVKAEGARYYRQHPLLADFAREKLGDGDGVAARTADYYYEFVQVNQKNYVVLEPEWGNIMACLATVHRLQDWPLLMDYAKVLDEPWFTGARYLQARQGYGWACQAAKEQKDETALTGYLTRWGYACCEQSDFDEAKILLNEAKEYAERLSNRVLVADAQFHLARIALERGDYEDAEQMLSDCQAIRVQIDDQSGVAKTIHLRAILFLRQGDSKRAEIFGLEALAIQQHLHDLPGILTTLCLLADCAFTVRDYALGEQFARRSLELLQGQAYKAELAEAYFALAMACRYQERLEEAWGYAERSRDLFEHIGNRACVSYVFYEQSYIKSLAGDTHSALQIGLKSLALMRMLSDDYNRVFCLRHLGDLYNELGRVPEARQLWEEGEQVAIRLRHPQMHLLRDRLQSTP